MKRNPLFFLGYHLVGSLLFNACLPKEEVLVNQVDPEGSLVQPQDEWMQVETAKEFSQLLGKVMQNKAVRITLSEYIQQYDDFGDFCRT
ncbi:MAG: hypothetical protein ACKO44_03945 [Algoriphagus sp.]